jgi:hypothetical protein
MVADETRMVSRRERDTLASASSRTHAVVVVGITVCAATPRSLRTKSAFAMPEMESEHVTYHA